MHRHDGGGMRRDGGFDLVRIKVERMWVNVHKYRLDTVPQQGMGSRHKGIGRGDHFAGDSQSLQGSDQCNRAVGE